jgi:glycosyltransferase involved in cell wall biosynthesis
VKIAVFHNLPSGGAKRALYNTVKYLKSVGNQVDVYVPSTANENYLPLKDIVDGFYVYPVRRTMRGVLSSSFRYLLPTYASSLLADFGRTQEHIAKAIDVGSYDVVLSEQDAFTWTPFVLRFLRTPSVYFCQQPSRNQEAVIEEVTRWAPQTAPVPFYKRIWRAHLSKRVQEIDKENASYAKYILANSYFSRETILRAYGLNSFVSYLGIDTALFRPLALPKENFILSVGACFPHKGYDFVLRSLGGMDKPIRPKMMIVANASRPTWEAHLMQMAARLEVVLEIKMDISDHELVGLYNRAKLFVFGAILEPFGLAPLEAMSCGTPVVAVKEGGVRETVLHTETGILTERDETEFAGAIVQLLKDQQWRERLGRRGAEVVRDFWTLEKAGERLTRHLDRARGVRSPLPLIADESALP